MNRLGLFLGVTVLTIGFFAPSYASAATLYFSTSTEAQIGSNVPVDVVVDSGGKEFNAAEAIVRFPTDILEVESVGTSATSTIFNFWLHTPRISNTEGTVSFAGGTMNARSGASVKVLRINFKVKGMGEALIIASNASVIIADGSGANILEAVRAMRLSVSDVKTEIPPASPPPQPELIVAEAPVRESVSTDAFFQDFPPIPPVITRVDKIEGIAGGTDLAISGIAEKGAHVHLNLQRGEETLDELIAIVDDQGDWTAVFRDIFTYGTYHIDAAADYHPEISELEQEVRLSDEVASADIRLFEPYSFAFGETVVPWYAWVYVLATILFITGRLIFFLRIKNLPPGDMLRRRRMHIYFTLAPFFFVTVMGALTYYWWQGVEPSIAYWKDTTVRCIQPRHEGDPTEYRHAQLLITIDGAPQRIPVGIGVSPDCLAEVHTRGNSGVIELERHVPGRELKLTDFFTVAGKTLEQPGYMVRVMINNVDQTAAVGTHSLEDGDIIHVIYETKES